MIVIIDNYDSFTFNLYQQVLKLGYKCQVFPNDKVPKFKADKIIISPGPGRPEDTGQCSKIIKENFPKIPILGVCLGHQLIGEIFGSKTIQAKKIMHGKTSKITHTNKGIFKGVKNPFEAARYHSLALDKLPKDFILTAKTSDGEIMGMQHQNHPIYSIQFHPESFMTTEGDKLMRNFLNV